MARKALFGAESVDVPAKPKRPRKPKPRTEKQQAEYDRDLRSEGEAVEIARFRAMEAAGDYRDQERRWAAIAELERVAAWQKPDQMRQIRAEYGDDAAERAQGRAQQAAYLLRNLPNYYEARPSTPAELEAAREWVRGRTR